MTTILVIAGALITLGGAALVVKKGWAVARKVSRFIDAVLGKPAEFGRDAEPGVLERMVLHEALLTDLHHEMHPNSGLSLRDAVDRLEQKATEAAATAAAVKADLATHTKRSERTFGEQNKAIASLAEAVKIAAQSTPPDDLQGG